MRGRLKARLQQSLQSKQGVLQNLCCIQIKFSISILVLPAVRNRQGRHLYFHRS
ncbi:hypothetical protein NEIELOOT_02975 [Neisseria elongata subsp. glycolytica ATCC 29315]|uniref:Uncharacterized protein n=1 Tax=Neisseria elongata subsp. glycolytica ATCC 29315 TaxID=546263 RepID=D4DV59_NEIEG|nr:hypothetical protein NEIELOOT_02975 [Neisseria elongata subsp. glycolytica ATCC 29315]